VDSRVLEDADASLSAVANHKPKSIDLGTFKPAAVLVPFVRINGALHLLFTLRPNHLKSHAGQVSFPGGGMDGKDASAWDTALRETYEELGIEPEMVKRVGFLDHYLTITSYHISPCVGLLEGLPSLAPSADEVDTVFTVPVSTLVDPRNRRTMLASRHLEASRIFFYLSEDHVIWGATGAILAHLFEVMGCGPPPLG
jgi:8-oxo-dGTP pyrophosphatase MutT (NUDIX family)